MHTITPLLGNHLYTMPRVGRIVVTLLKMGTPWYPRMASSYTPQGFGVFTEPFYIPKFTCKTGPLLVGAVGLEPILYGF